MARKKQTQNGKRKFTVNTALSVGIVTVVEAESEAEAIEIAMTRGVQSLCHQCSGGDYDREWSLTDGLSGDPSEDDAVAQEDT